MVPKGNKHRHHIYKAGSDSMLNMFIVR